ncbi:MAG: energy transducer TonB [candidate division KSB1 bacterium]|nr:energy transducer TonB [candidate division KSB1 bacterium]
MRTRLLLCLLLLTVTLACGNRGRFRPARVAGDRELDYPLEAQLARIEGEVSLSVFVNREGKPEDIKILQSSGSDILDSAAFRYIRNLNFFPALLNEKPVDSWTRLILRYKLTDVAFEEARWVDEVLGFQSAAKFAANSEEREEALRKLYIRYIGLVTYVEKYPRLSVNDAVRKVCLRETNDYWEPLRQVVPMTFAVFDDFLRRYPDSALSAKVKEDLIRQLSLAEAEIRVAALSSAKSARNAPALIALIEKRLDELSNTR